MQNNTSLHLKLPDPTTACTFHRSFYCSLIHWSILQLFTDPSTIQPFFVHWSIAWSPTHSAYILINSLLSDESLLGFLHDPSLELLPDPTHVTSIAPLRDHWSIALHRAAVLEVSGIGMTVQMLWSDPSLTYSFTPSHPPSLIIHSFIHAFIQVKRWISEHVKARWMNDRMTECIASVIHRSFVCSLVHRLITEWRWNSSKFPQTPF